MKYNIIYITFKQLIDIASCILQALWVYLRECNKLMNNYAQGLNIQLYLF